jgi:hypothetical protein
VKTAVICGAAILVVLLDLIASTRVLRSRELSRAQQIAWLLLVWLAPLVGSVLALSLDSNADAPPARSGESGSEMWIPGIGPDDSAPGGNSD